MRLSSFFSIATISSVAVASTFDDVLERRQADDSYLNEVCYPNSTDPVPPCQEIINIQTQCLPNGTSTLDYLAHQQCMCNGGFFDNWTGCLDCEYVHGIRSENVTEIFSSIISSASTELCTGTPTAAFAAIFSSLSEENNYQFTSDSGSLTDQYPSQTAVSLYFTASGATGAGVITGSATAATATATTSDSDSSSVVALTGSSSAKGSATTSHSSTSGSSTHSSSATAASATSTGGASTLNIAGTLLVVLAGGMVAIL